MALSQDSQPGQVTPPRVLGLQRKGQGCSPVLLLPHSPTGPHILTYVHTQHTISQLYSHPPVHAQSIHTPTLGDPEDQPAYCAHGGLGHPSLLLGPFPDRRWLFEAGLNLFGQSPLCPTEVPACLGQRRVDHLACGKCLQACGAQMPGQGVGFFQLLNGTGWARLEAACV